MHTNKTNELIFIVINTMVFSINHQTEIKIILYCVIVIKLPETSTCTVLVTRF